MQRRYQEHPEAFYATLRRGKFCAQVMRSNLAISGMLTKVQPMPHVQDSTTALPESEPAFYRLADVVRITALSRSSIYRRIAAGEFPPQVSLGGRATGWRREALRAWISDPSGFRPLTSCDVQRTSSGARVRHVSPAPASPRPGRE